MKKFILGFGLLMVLALPAHANHAPNASHAVITVNGLVCDFCARAVEKVFGKREEVAAVRVDLSKHQVEIDLKNDMNISDEDITKYITDAGYTLVEIKRL